MFYSSHGKTLCKRSRGNIEGYVQGGYEGLKKSLKFTFIFSVTQYIFSE